MRQIRFQLIHEALNPIDRLARARHEQLDPFRSRRQHLNREEAQDAASASPHDLNQRAGSMGFDRKSYAC